VQITEITLHVDDGVGREREGGEREREREFKRERCVGKAVVMRVLLFFFFFFLAGWGGGVKVGQLYNTQGK
jgi:hypothetical protein